MNAGHGWPRRSVRSSWLEAQTGHGVVPCPDFTKGKIMKYVVVTVLGGIYQFRHECTTKAEAFDCAKRASKETPEPVDVWFNGNCIEMFKAGKRY